MTYFIMTYFVIHTLLKTWSNFEFFQQLFGVVVQKIDGIKLQLAHIVNSSSSWDKIQMF